MMRNKLSIILASLTFVLVGYLLGLATAWVLVSRAQAQELSAAHRMALFWEAWSIVEKDFLHELPNERTLTYGAIRGALGTLQDPFTAFIEPQPNQREKESLKGSFGGIGVKMRRDGANNVILSPTPDSPAQRAGVQEGDILIAVDSKPITPSISFDAIAAMVRGPVGQAVTIDIQRGDPPVTHTFKIVRQEIVLPSVTWRIIDDKPGVGYIALEMFSERSNAELVNAINDLKKQGATRLILDLRNNGGGLRQSAIKVASQFLTGGVVMYQRQKNQPAESFEVIRGGVATDLPLVILVNKGTASASEIVAGALQDRGRAKLVGEQTFGKGSVQHIYDLSDGSSLHVTTAEWLTPNHRQITKRGLTPDVIVTLTQEDANAGRDPQLDAALEELMRSAP
jgi:carboxyl-terminal processing protease